MLRVSYPSGKQAASIPRDQLYNLHNVQALKRLLHNRYLCATRFRQRLLYRDRSLQDEDRLDGLIDDLQCSANEVVDVQLILLNYCETSAQQASALRTAAESGDTAVIESLLQRPQCPDFCEPGVQATPLHAAVVNEQCSVVEQLLDANADTNSQVGGGVPGTAMLKACRLGHFKIVSLLLQAGANPDTADVHGERPLLAASGRGFRKIVEALLRASAAADVRGHDNLLPVERAYRNGHVDVVCLLLCQDVPMHVMVQVLHWACVNSHWAVLQHVFGISGETILQEICPEDAMKCLMWTCEKGDVEVLELLLHNWLQHFPQPFMNTEPLRAAAKSGHSRAVWVLLQHGADAASSSPFQRSPLLEASSRGYSDIVRFLVDAGADVNEQDRDSDTPLGAAAELGYVEVVRLLLEAGCNSDAVDDDGATPLLLAAAAGHKQIVRLLLKAGCEIDPEDDDGATPLARAAMRGHRQIASLLVQAGACPRICLMWACEKGYVEVLELLLHNWLHHFPQPFMNTEPLRAAAKSGHSRAVWVLLQHGADAASSSPFQRSPLLEASSRGYSDIVRFLVDAGADVNEQDRDSNTPLGAAAELGYVEVVRLLLEAGCNSDAVDDDGATPLLLAAAAGHKQIVRLLLKAGCEIDPEDDDGATPLARAAMRGHRQVVQLLLEAGCKIDPVDFSGATPLARAATRGHTQIVQLLLEAGCKIDPAISVGQPHLHARQSDGTGCKIDPVDFSGAAPLAHAAKRGH